MDQKEKLNRFLWLIEEWNDGYLNFSEDDEQEEIRKRIEVEIARLISNNVKQKTTEQASDEQVGGNHYKKYEIQPTEFCVRNNIGFLEGNVIKYTLRHADKNGVQDIDKAIHYLKLLKQYKYGE